ETWYINNLYQYSMEKNLYSYQVSALQSVIKSLYLYYEKSLDYLQDEGYEDVLKRKSNLSYIYQNNNAPVDKLHLKRLKKNQHLIDIYEDFLPFENNEMNFDSFSNRLSLWMATGSGKTLIIVKLFELIHQL